MYKAGDFTNGKMNEIFKSSFRLGGHAYDCGVEVSHKQLGKFYIVSEGGLVAPSILALCEVSGFKDYVNPIMSDHNSKLDSEDPSRFNLVSSYLSSVSPEKLLTIANDFFNEKNNGLGVQFSNLFSLLNYLICEKGCTYSGNQDGILLSKTEYDRLIADSKG